MVDEEPVGIFHVYNDISEQKNNEKALQQQAEELLRTNEQLERFAYITSHNLRAPVANLTALLDLFDPNAIKDDPMGAIFQKIESSIYQMNDTVNDLVDIVSRKNQSQQPKETVYFRDLLEKVKLTFAQSIEESRAIIHADFMEAPSIQNVKTSIQNILYELMGNALKFQSQDRRLEISLRTEPIDDFVCLTFEDNGLGFDVEKDGVRAFEFYKKLHSNTPGKGKGLYLIKSLVESLGGQIHVNSQTGKGTTFYVYLKDLNRSL
jgi:signal transduction histidine kinase